ncbi:hypothetical protein IW262DRAFT_1496562 [Armillaria fumosa]|nr:hypothetical protein IW262DRAFT_1496562 [Armillaria fumosa]
MFSTARKVLQFLFYSAMASLAPHDVHTEPPKNTIIFQTDPHVRKGRRSQNAFYYLSDIAERCPHGAGEAVIKKVEFMKSSRVPNLEFLLCHVKDPKYPWQGYCYLDRARDSAPPQQEPRTDSLVPSLQPPTKDSRSLSSESVLDTSSHSSSPSLFGQALDLFTIFCMSVIAFKDYDVLSTLTFNDDSTFSAEEAAVMAMVASDATDEYSVISHRCYWYARPWKVRIVNDAASNIFIPPSDTSQRLAHTYLAKWLQWRVDIEERKKEKDAPLLEAQRREESLLRKLQRKDEELARKQKELDDYKKDQILRLDRVSSSRPNAI